MSNGEKQPNNNSNVNINIPQKSKVKSIGNYTISLFKQVSLLDKELLEKSNWEIIFLLERKLQ